jgi:5'-phosphate synthase pdxT subunit
MMLYQLSWVGVHPEPPSARQSSTRRQKIVKMQLLQKHTRQARFLSSSTIKNLEGEKIRSFFRTTSFDRRMAAPEPLTVGVVALQGAFREHLQHIDRLNPFEDANKKIIQLHPILVRNSADLSKCSALIIPGGESTAIALGAQRAGLLEPLRDWIRDDKPTWGTCAGMILLAREATGGKKSGQDLLGGLDIRVGRNGYGSQVDSFEEPLYIPALKREQKLKADTGLEADDTFPGVFIRAPVIESLLLPEDILSVEPSEPTMVARGEGEAHENMSIKPQQRLDSEETGTPLSAIRPLAVQQISSYSSISSASSFSSASSTSAQLAVAPPLERPGQPRKKRPALEILATLSHLPRGAKGSIGGNGEDDEQEHSIIGERPEHDSMIVALKQGNIMCTSFHPELTGDARLHDYFIRHCVLDNK